MKFYKPTIIFLFSIIYISAFGMKHLQIEEIRRLDKLITEKDHFDSMKHARIDSLKSLISSTSKDPNKFIALGDEYTLFKADSAMLYYSKALDIAEETGDSELALYIRLRRIRPEMIAGFYAEAHDAYRQISQNGIPEKLLSDYYECGYRIYSFALNSAETGSSYHDRYYTLTNDFRQKWIASLPESSKVRQLYEAEQALWDKKYSKAKLIAGELLSELPETSNEYAIAAAILANLMKQQSNMAECMRYFALSAISDIKCSVKENNSIFELSLALFESDDIDRAYNYIFASIEDAAFCNAQVRVYNASRMLPVIEASHRDELARHETMLITYIIIVSILFIGLAITVLMLIRQMKKLSSARKKLHDANTTKDEYMGQFLDLCTVYMKKLDSFTKLVNRKLASGQIEDLAKMTKSSKFSEEQHQGFYSAFDLAFLKIYTTFVDDVNKLLRPEERFEIEIPNTLNTELRIYALVRLGISDSTKIAEFLKYSVNTIYTYRNKVKNKAINRADFEENIMKIGIIE